MSLYGIGNIELLHTWYEDPAPTEPPPVDPPPDPVPEFLFTSQVPAFTDNNDNPYTLGTVMTVDVPGQVVGIRFYVGTTPTVSPVGVLYQWDSNTAGTELAQKPFPGPYVEGEWTSVLFDDPVDVVAGQKYVAAVGPIQPYCSTSLFFDTAGLTNGHITAIQNAGGVTNGKFHVGLSTLYPPDSFNASCYFIDFLFLPDEA